ncbi:MULTISPECIES: AHH domain-containing protein [unclassified Myxococcus]|uniref:AHH domain-containing protein n=1 Tax=unclassified Myxococcus TaxID=2648731 RepID=UPI001CBA9F1B|nr:MULTISPECIES: AHH domain-containing protein [unclassified Myxococcus]MBZ4396476.1 AHH domain-containing protein [Myxococcus sp. AS-1-15]MBZ4411815.1 AHH domain-containing protein [Myxococcus sp. XM-1-1-1]BDT37989.1 AHH domain-containing protein [Myxococcus sp. MH1]
MRIRWAVPLLLLMCITGCATTRTVRLETGQDSFVVTPREEPDAELASVELDDEEFEAALTVLARDVRPQRNPMRQARDLFGVPPRGGVYGYEDHPPRLTLQSREDADGLRLLEAYADEELTRAYGLWCERKDRPGDCLRLLEEGPLLASDGKFTWAFAIAMDSVWEETAEALEDMVDPVAVMSTITAGATMYLMLWALPEPLSKGVAATFTALAIAYLGVDTVWRLLDGWLTLVREVERATTYAQLHAASEAYGEVLGENAARVFVMLATAAVGSTAGLASKAVGLPGSAQAALAVESQAGIRFVAVGGVRTVAVTAEGFTLALAPTAMAMANQGMSGGERHHIATNKNDVSSTRGGPWSPRFRKLFARAGMELKDPENIVRVSGHKGPHPKKYHDAVFLRLQDALGPCRTVEACRTALTRELRNLATEAQTPGTVLNRLVTQGK